MDTRNKSTAKTPETGEAVAKVKASSKAWLRAVAQEKERREKETRELSRDMVVPRAPLLDDEEEVNYNEEEASVQPEENLVGDSSKDKEEETSDVTNEEEEGDFQASKEEEENPRAPEEEARRKEEKDLRVSQAKDLGQQHPKRMEPPQRGTGVVV